MFGAITASAGVIEFLLFLAVAAFVITAVYAAVKRHWIAFGLLLGLGFWSAAALLS